MQAKFINQFLRVVLITLIGSLLLSCSQFSDVPVSRLPRGFDFADTFLYNANIGMYIGGDLELNSFLGINGNTSIQGVEILIHSLPDDVAARVNVDEFSQIDIKDITKGPMSKVLGGEI